MDLTSGQKNRTNRNAKTPKLSAWKNTVLIENINSKYKKYIYVQMKRKTRIIHLKTNKNMRFIPLICAFTYIYSWYWRDAVMYHTHGHQNLLQKSYTIHVYAIIELKRKRDIRIFKKKIQINDLNTRLVIVCAPSLSYSLECLLWLPLCITFAQQTHFFYIITSILHYVCILCQPQSSFLLLFWWDILYGMCVYYAYCSAVLIN